MTDETMAERRYRAMLSPDRDRQLADMRQRLRERGNSEDATRLDAMMSEFEQTDGAALHKNPVDAMIVKNARQVKSALADLGADADRLATVYVGSALDEDVSAQIRSYSDGSGLVQVSDAIISLSTVYGLFTGDLLAAATSVGRLRGMWRMSRALRRGRLGDDPAVLVGLLRYYNVHQRVYGLAAKLEQRVTDEAQLIAMFISLHAVRFVIGHEVAHHVLNHGSASSAFSPGEHVPACSAGERRELDADLLAYRATVRAAQCDLAEVGGSSGANIEIFAALGALAAMLTVHSTERALFLRRGTTHPSAGARAALLLGQLGPRERNVADMFMHNLLAATELSSVFDESATRFDWKWFASAPSISSGRPPEYLHQIWLLDTLQCQSVPRLVEILDRTEQDANSALSKGAHLAATGSIEQALLTWGVAPDVAAHICDRHAALTFHSVVDELRTSLPTLGIPPDSARSDCVAAARLVATGLATS